MAQDLVLTACLWPAQQQLHAAGCLALGCVGEQHIHAVPVAAGRYKAGAVRKQYKGSERQSGTDSAGEWMP